MIGIRPPAEAWEDVDEGVDGLLEEWLVAEQDAVEAGQPIAGAIVMKTSFEVLAPAAGTIDSIAVAAGETFGPEDDLGLIAATDGAAAAPSVAAPPSAAAANPSRDTGGSKIPFTGIRGAVARNMSAAWQQPRVAAGVTVDMRESLALAKSLQAKLGPELKLTPTHLVLRALALTLAEHPRLNGTVAEDGVEVAAEIALGLAVSLPEGIMVPVIRDAPSKSIADLVRESSRLADGAREGTLGSGDMSGGTFTVSTLGSTGIDWFTPILNPPQIAILGVGGIAERPLATAGEVIPAPTMDLTLVYDHRAVDGHPASTMLAALRLRLQRAELDIE